MQWGMGKVGDEIGREESNKKGRQRREVKWGSRVMHHPTLPPSHNACLGSTCDRGMCLSHFSFLREDSRRDKLEDFEQSPGKIVFHSFV